MPDGGLTTINSIHHHLQNEVTKKMAPPNPNTDGLLPAGVSGRLILRSEDKLTLFEQQSRRVINEIQAVRIKYISWNRDGSLVALMGKHSLVLATRNLEQLCAVTETVRIKVRTDRQTDECGDVCMSVLSVWPHIASFRVNPH